MRRPCESLGTPLRAIQLAHSFRRTDSSPPSIAQRVPLNGRTLATSRARRSLGWIRHVIDLVLRRITYASRAMRLAARRTRCFRVHDLYSRRAAPGGTLRAIHGTARYAR